VTTVHGHISAKWHIILLNHSNSITHLCTSGNKLEKSAHWLVSFFALSACNYGEKPGRKFTNLSLLEIY
jgi:hypothetical protein